MFYRILIPILASIGYISLFQYQICPNVPYLQSNLPYVNYQLDLSAVEPFLSQNCKIINEINTSNINHSFDNIEFWYKIYVQNRWNYFTHYHYPVLKLKTTNFYNAIELNYLKYVKPTIDSGLTTVKNHLSIYYKVFEIQLGKFKVFVLKTEIYKTYLETKLDYLYYHVNKILQNLQENSSIKKFHQKTSFLSKEFKNVVKMKFKSKAPKKVHVSVIKDILEDTGSGSEIDSNEYDDDEDLEPITIKLTSTIYEYSSMQTLTPAEQNINDLLNSFESKVKKTMDLALINISKEINPIINSTIDIAKPEMTEIFKFIQNENYKYYKEAHEMISKIDKDLSNLKEFGYENYNETVSRQDMRDKIESIKFFNSNQFMKLESIINDKFKYLIDSYLIIIQDTIDILESFADSTFQVFSNDLSIIIGDSDNEDFNWKSWKQFHSLKTLLWDKRDFIFNQAEILKQKNWGELEIDSNFKNWLKFINEINIHMSFLSQDNQEYLQLIRAKANVSYQLREAEIYKIENELKVEEVPKEEEPKEEEPKEEEPKEEEPKEEEPKEEPMEEAEEYDDEYDDEYDEEAETVTKTLTKTVKDIETPILEDLEIDDIEPDQDPDTDE